MQFAGQLSRPARLPADLPVNSWLILCAWPVTAGHGGLFGQTLASYKTFPANILAQLQWPEESLEHGVIFF